MSRDVCRGPGSNLILQTGLVRQAFYFEVGPYHQQQPETVRAVFCGYPEDEPVIFLGKPPLAITTSAGFSSAPPRLNVS
jgi:hypothetical protein